MEIKQISVFLENKSGRLANVTKVLSDGKVNIRALSIADTSDFGILRLIVDKPEDAYNLLKKEGFTVSTTEVIAVSVPDKPGGLSEVLSVLKEEKINLEYLYAFIGKPNDMAIMICRVENAAKAREVLQTNKMEIISSRDICNL